MLQRWPTGDRGGLHAPGGRRRPRSARRVSKGSRANATRWAHPLRRYERAPRNCAELPRVRRSACNAYGRPHDQAQRPQRSRAAQQLDRAFAVDERCVGRPVQRVNRIDGHADEAGDQIVAPDAHGPHWAAVVDPEHANAPLSCDSLQARARAPVQRHRAATASANLSSPLEACKANDADACNRPAPRDPRGSAFGPTGRAGSKRKASGSPPRRPATGADTIPA